MTSFVLAGGNLHLPIDVRLLGVFAFFNDGIEDDRRIRALSKGLEVTAILYTSKIYLNRH
jgi:hypothetical protein